MAAVSRDKILIGSALLLAIASTAAFGYLSMRHSGVPSGPIPQVQLADAPYAPTAPDAPPIKTETWAAPVAQTRGREWIYDAFTPPEIFYNARSKQFTVKPPSSLMDEEAQESFGVELVAVRPEPFRLHLTGFVGSEGSYRGMLHNVTSIDQILATNGHRLPALGLTIK